MSTDKTFVDVLRSRVGRNPQGSALTFLEDGEVPASLTYEALDQRARDIAAGLHTTVQAGDRALLLHPPGLEFVTAFFGCLYAGVVPVPAYPPRNPRHFPRIEAIVADADVRCVLTQSDFHGRLAAWLDRRAGSLPAICTDTLRGGNGDWAPGSHAGSDAPAFLQYTSGSTGDPKGVMITHGNLMSNQRMIQQAFGHGEGLIGVSWLPIYHDMGLVGNLLQPLFLGGHCVFMSPAAFLQKPRRWLAAITNFRAHGSGGPNFAFRLCAKSVRGEQLAGLDLSSLRTLFCGSEPINAADLDEFADAFREVGFRRESLYCCYGMAETTLLATGSTPQAGPVLEKVDADALSTNVARPPRSATSISRTVVGCGRAVEGQDLIVVNPETGDLLLEDGRIGEIWVRGPNVALGYWRKPDLTRETFGGRLSGAGSGDKPFLRTGDLGFLRNGELFVTGRIKDLIIIRGRNHYPHDIELTVQKSHPAFLAGAGAAFSMEIDGEERLVVVQEIDRHRHQDAEDATAAMRAAIVEEYEISPYSIVLVKQSAIPKTSSGKIQRGGCARELREGTLPVVYKWIDTAALAASDSVRAGEDAAGSGESRTREQIEDFLLQKLAGGLGVSPDDVDVNQPFSSFGLDSLRTLALLDDVETWLGRSLSPTLFWDYPTIAELAAHLVSEAAEQSAADSRRR